jgi:hypothetical protein
MLLVTHRKGREDVSTTKTSWQTEASAARSIVQKWRRDENRKKSEIGKVLSRVVLGSDDE